MGGSGEMDITQDQGEPRRARHHSDKSVCLHVCLSVHHVHAWCCGASEGFRATGSGVTDGSEPILKLGVSHVLPKSSKCS